MEGSAVVPPAKDNNNETKETSQKLGVVAPVNLEEFINEIGQRPARVRKKKKVKKNDAGAVDALVDPQTNLLNELSESDLLKCTGAEIDLYIEKLHEKRVVVDSDKQGLKVVRRLIKNRESAQKSRNKKNQELKEHKQWCSVLRIENEALKQHLLNLESETQVLRVRVALLERPHLLVSE